MSSRLHLYFIAIGLVIFSILFSLSKGAVAFPWHLIWENDQFKTIFFKLRLPRTCAAFVSGGLLALAGSLMQLLLQNPLADPYILGISSGAAFFTLLLMYIGASAYWLVTGAWAGSLLTIIFILLLARKHGWQTDRLLLSGITLSCGFSAGISFILVISPDTHLHNMLFWLMGDLNDAQFPGFALIILCLGACLCQLLAPGLNILYRGDNEAKMLGLPTTYYRIVLYLLSSLFTAAAVTLAGCIGFIGLIIPHIVRMIAGYDHRHVLPLSLLLGGSLLTIADTLARSLVAPQQLPVGILTALIGIPIFIWLLQK